MYRRDIILEGMFLDIATPEEKLKIDELYNQGHKGSAVVYMLKRIRTEWVKMINRKHAYPTQRKPAEIKRFNNNNEFVIPRFLNLRGGLSSAVD